MTRHPGSAPFWRCVLVAGATSVAMVALLVWLRPELRAASAATVDGDLAAQPFDRLLVWSCAAGTAGCAVWLAVVTALLAADAARGRATDRPWVPTPVRRWVLAACGLALGTALAPPALAEPPRHADAPRVRSSLTALPLPDRATTTSYVSHLVLRADARVVPVAGAARTVVVEPGDTLWALARAELGADASDVEVARRCRAIHEANRSTIGADPDLIRPGQHLELPRPRHQP